MSEPTPPHAPSPSPEVLAARARRLIEELSHVQDPAAFTELLSLSETVGVALGQSARTVAQAQSWSQVASYAGTSKQAAWSRWSS
ncbi:MAG: hypothetical protein WBG57_02925 [Ornithinimicrobium sp.]